MHLAEVSRKKVRRSNNRLLGTGFRSAPASPRARRRPLPTEEPVSTLARAVFDIFLSSTSVDLQDYRAKVSEMVARMRQSAIRMETFDALPTKPLDSSVKWVRRMGTLVNDWCLVSGHQGGGL